MKNVRFRVFCVAVPTLLVLAGGARVVRPVAAQNQEMQERVADIKLAAAQNKQAMEQYTWVEQVTISLKGEQKKQEHFQVRLGPDGKPQKQSLDPPPAEPEHEGRLKKHIVEKKTEEYKEYADRIKELIQQYVPPEKDKLEQAYQSGSVMVGPVAGVAGQYRLVISNYIKQGDNMTLVMDKTQKNLVGVSISTYMDDPHDAVKVNVEFAPIPSGPNHISAETINGVSKELTVAIQNSNYQQL